MTKTELVAALADSPDDAVIVGDLDGAWFALGVLGGAWLDPNGNPFITLTLHDIYLARSYSAHVGQEVEIQTQRTRIVNGRVPCSAGSIGSPPAAVF